MLSVYRRCRCVSRECEVSTRCARSTCFHPTAKLWIHFDPLITWARIKLLTQVKLHVFTLWGVYFQVNELPFHREMSVSIILLKVNAHFGATSWPPTCAVTWLAAASNKWNAQFEASSCSAASADARYLCHMRWSAFRQDGRYFIFTFCHFFPFCP